MEIERLKYDLMIANERCDKMSAQTRKDAFLLKVQQEEINKLRHEKSVLETVIDAQKKVGETYVDDALGKRDRIEVLEHRLNTQKTTIGLLEKQRENWRMVADRERKVTAKLQYELTKLGYDVVITRSEQGAVVEVFKEVADLDNLVELKGEENE